MSMNMGPTDAISQEQMLEALNKYDLENKKEAEKKKEQEEFNEFVNAVQDINAFTNIITMIHQYQEARKEALLTADMDEKKLHETKAQELRNSIEAYYAGNKEAAQQALAEYDKKTEPEKIQALDKAIDEIKSKKEDILKKWVSTDDKNIWLGKSWEDAVTDQAAHYARKNEKNVRDAANENIATLEQKGIKLSDAEKKALADSGEPALETFKAQLALMKLSEANNPMAYMVMEMLFVGLITNTTQGANDVIRKLNMERPPESQIPLLDLELRKGLKFAKEKAKGDREQMGVNVQNHILLRALDRQEQALHQTKAGVTAQQTASAAPAANIIHCEVKATSPSVYDSDAGSRFALHPQSSSNYSILRKACDALNQQTNGEKLIIHKQDGRNIQFEFNKQRFNFDSGSAQFSADNINPQTFQMMMKLYNQVYKGSDTQVKCDDSVSKKICEAGIADFNNTNQSKITNPKIVFSSAGKLAAATTEKAGVTEKQEAQVQQNVTSSRRM